MRGLPSLPALRWFAVALVAAGALLAIVPSAGASVWTRPTGTRIFPGTAAGTVQTVKVSAAGGEYEGVIIGVRGGARRSVAVTWVDTSDPFLTTNSIVDQVAFVDIRRPTTGTGAKPGLYPDPLLPRHFGTAFTVPAHSSSVYVLFHVPYGTPAGTYLGSLHVKNGGEQADLPVQLRVWDFGWQRLSVRTGFAVKSTQVGPNPIGFYRMLMEHGITAVMPKVVPATSSNGAIQADRYANKLSPYLDDTGLGMPTARLPWLGWWPSYSWKYRAGDSRLLRYLTDVCKVYKAHGWQDKLFAYPVDEPTSTREERRAEALARTVHKASAAAGFRCKFLLTDDPRPTTLHALLPANKFLWDDVDIWCLRYYYFFGRVPIVRQLKAKGAEIWWYPYCNTSVAKLPNFVIDKSLADSRVWGWLMYQWNVDGLVYWGVNKWANARPGSGARDPYRDPISFVWPDGRVCNGEASLVYPGYYPRYGLTNRYAPPVSSLRLEALRDGFEDLEYLRIATKLVGSGLPHAATRSITWFPYPIRYGHLFNFPKYVKTPGAFAKARGQVAQAIEQALAPSPPPQPSSSAQ
jgi:Glycoside hydrolase 123, catalytic domain